MTTYQNITGCIRRVPIGHGNFEEFGPQEIFQTDAELPAAYFKKVDEQKAKSLFADEGKDKK